MRQATCPSPLWGRHRRCPGCDRRPSAVRWLFRCPETHPPPHLTSWDPLEILLGCNGSNSISGRKKLKLSQPVPWGSWGICGNGPWPLAPGPRPIKNRGFSSARVIRMRSLEWWMMQGGPMLGLTYPMIAMFFRLMMCNTILEMRRKYRSSPSLTWDSIAKLKEWAISKWFRNGSETPFGSQSAALPNLPAITLKAPGNWYLEHDAVSRASECGPWGGCLVAEWCLVTSNQQYIVT